MKFLSDCRLLILAIWLGAALFFIGVAQSAFAVLPSREMAGSVVNRTLSILNYGGLTIGLILVLTSLVTRGAANRILLWTERVLLVIIVAACAIGQFVIGLWMQFTRAQMGGRAIDDLAADDPLRVQFNNLHEYSVWVLMAGMIAAMLAFFLIANRRAGTAAATSQTTTSDPFDFSKEFKKS